MTRIFLFFLVAALLPRMAFGQDIRPKPDTFLKIGGAIEAARLALSPRITWAGKSRGSAALAALWAIEMLSGKSTIPGKGNYLEFNKFEIDDGINLADSSNMGDGLFLYDNISGSALGSRNLLRTRINVATRPADTLIGTNFPAYVSLFPTAQASVNVGGSGADGFHSAGSIYGTNPNVLLLSGATNFYALVGAEIDVTALSGSSVFDKNGLLIVEGWGDAVRGKFDAAIDIANQPNATGWQCGICFNGLSGVWPISPTGTIISNGTGGGKPMAAYGIDFSGVAFSGNAIKLGPAGSISVNNATIASSMGSVGACTGLGTGSCSINPGSTDFAGSIALSPKGTPASRGAIVVTHAQVAPHNAVCTFAAMDGRGAWIAPVTFIETENTAKQFTIHWTNGRVLTSGATYRVNYMCVYE